MANYTKPQPPKPSSQGVTVSDVHAASVVYFDGATNFGHLDGVILKVSLKRF